MADPTDITTPSDSDKVKLGASEIRTLKDALNHKISSYTANVTLPSIVGQAGKYLIINPGETGFMFATPPSAAGTAGDLASQLLSTTDANKGAGQVAVNLALPYPAGTVGYTLNSLTTGLGALTNTLTNNMLVNGECSRVAPTFDWLSSNGVSRRGIGYGWAQSSGIGSGSNTVPGIAVILVNNSNAPAATGVPNYVLIANEAGHDVATRPISSLFVAAAGKTYVDSSASNLATIVTFDLATTIVGDFLLELVYYDPLVSNRVRYYKKVTVTDSSGNWAHYSVSIPSLTSSYPFAAVNQLNVAVKFVFVNTAGGSPNALNTWVTSSTGDLCPTITSSVASDVTFSIKIGNVKAERSTTGIATPFVRRSLASLQSNADIDYFTTWKSPKSGIFAGTLLTIVMHPENYNKGNFQSATTAVGEVAYAAHALTVYGSNNTPVNLTSFTNAGPGGAPNIQTAAITSGALGSTNGIWVDTDPNGIIMYAASFGDGNTSALSHCVIA